MGLPIVAELCEMNQTRARVRDIEDFLDCWQPLG